MDLGLTFGSVGDLIAITVLIKDIIAALDDTCGSTKEYQYLVRELDTLRLTLEAVQRTFEDPQLIHSLEDLAKIALDTVTQINDCLNGFQNQICKYEPTLSAGASGKSNCLKAVGRKVQWKLNEREVERFRAEVMGCTMALNVLLKVITISGIELKSSIGQVIAMMCTISGDLSSIRAIVMRLDRGTNDEYFILEDITGRMFPIHLRTITSWTVLEFILSERFKGKKGARRVQRKLYSLRESNTQREIDGYIPWESAFLPHQKITMSLICKDTENENREGRGLASCPFCKTPSDHDRGVEVECAKCKRYFTRVVELDDPEAPHNHPTRLHSETDSDDGDARGFVRVRLISRKRRATLKISNQGDQEGFAKFERVREAERSSVEDIGWGKYILRNWLSGGKGIEVDPAPAQWLSIRRPPTDLRDARKRTGVNYRGTSTFGDDDSDSDSEEEDRTCFPLVAPCPDEGVSGEGLGLLPFMIPFPSN
ncbi:unnamed protein product [Fusarium equiseti]|uniref:Ubiquitin-like domain-containing protein n=1 Tax=Fusarium equiseti TaxID=61235 RepID=A0A8J2IF14_FUSEQ|nr:unnamed protein product [Fusarium equiseti]